MYTQWVVYFQGIPFQDRADWKNYSAPDIHKEGRLEQIRIAVQKAKEYRMTVISSTRGPFTPTWLLYGYERFSVLLYEEPDFLDRANMDIGQIQHAYGQELTLVGNIDNQGVLVYGSVDASPPKQKNNCYFIISKPDTITAFKRVGVTFMERPNHVFELDR